MKIIGPFAKIVNSGPPSPASPSMLCDTARATAGMGIDGIDILLNETELTAIIHES